MTLGRQRLVSGGLFVLGSLALLVSVERELAATLTAALILGLVVIWQAETLAALTGLRFGTVDSASPAPFVRFLGWLLFLAACAATVQALVSG